MVFHGEAIRGCRDFLDLSTSPEIERAGRLPQSASMVVREEPFVEESVATACAQADRLRARADRLLALADEEQCRIDRLRTTAQAMLEHARDLEELVDRAPQLRLGIPSWGLTGTPPDGGSGEARGIEEVRQALLEVTQAEEHLAALEKDDAGRAAAEDALAQAYHGYLVAERDLRDGRRLITAA